MDSLRIFWLRLYGWRTRMRGFWFCPAMCAASIAPAEARVSESITKKRTRAFSFARCSRAMRSGVHCETCYGWKDQIMVSVWNNTTVDCCSTYRIIERNAKFIQLRHGDVRSPRRGIARTAKKYFRRFHHQFFTFRSPRFSLCVKHELLFYPKWAFRREWGNLEWLVTILIGSGTAGANVSINSECYEKNLT